MLSRLKQEISVIIPFGGIPSLNLRMIGTGTYIEDYSVSTTLLTADHGSPFCTAGFRSLTMIGSM